MPKGTPKPPDRTEDYVHRGAKRTNNPEAGLHSADKVKVPPRVKYQYDPHLDPQLVWASKAERSEVEVETVSLHKHEVVRPQDIVSLVQGVPVQGELFGDPRLPIHKAVEFYKHDQLWMNRLVLGDSLLVMNSLLHKENLGGHVQMIYIDPPYGIGYNSNFQPRTDRRDVTNGKDDSLSREPEQIKAYRDTWALGVHSYLSYLRDRLMLARELLAKQGSIFVQINDQNLHHVRELLDEVFGEANFVSQIFFQTTSGFETKTLATLGDILLWYARDKERLKVRRLYEEQPLVLGEGNARWLLLSDGTYRSVTEAEKRGQKSIPKGARPYMPDNLQGQGSSKSPQPFVLNGKSYSPGPNGSVKFFVSGSKRLVS